MLIVNYVFTGVNVIYYIVLQVFVYVINYFM